MSPVYERDKVVAYVVDSGGNYETVCAECLQRNDTVTSVYDEDDVGNQNLLIICDRCEQEC